MQRTALTLLGLLAFSPVALGGETPAPDGAYAYFILPADGEELSSPVKVVLGLHKMGVAPAGASNENTGHHHLIIDAPAPLDAVAIPADDNHVHFGGGQTEAMIELQPGTHTLQLLLGDGNHAPHNPPVTSKQITITVK